MSNVNLKMRLVVTLVALLVGGMFVASGCSSEGESATVEVVDQVVDRSERSAPAEVPVITPVVSVDRSDPVVAPEKLSDSICDIVDLVIVGDRLYAVHAGGLVVHDLKLDQTNLIEANQRFRAVAIHNGQVYVGGSELYMVEGSTLVEVDVDLRGSITSFCSNGYYLMVGTEDALYGKSLFGIDLLLDDVAVSAMVSDGATLWVGTDGQGLFSYDGQEFKRRFLLRDTTLFDFVTAIDYHVGHLYVGTPDELWDFDGGRWQALSYLGGLLSTDISWIDASSWVVYVATTEGVVSFFNGEFAPVGTLEDRSVNVIGLHGRKLIVGTDSDGILMKSGPALKTIVDPAIEPESSPDEAETVLTDNSF